MQQIRCLNEADRSMNGRQASSARSDKVPGPWAAKWRARSQLGGPKPSPLYGGPTVPWHDSSRLARAPRRLGPRPASGHVICHLHRPHRRSQGVLESSLHDARVASRANHTCHVGPPVYVCRRGVAHAARCVADRWYMERVAEAACRLHTAFSAATSPNPPAASSIYLLIH